MLIILDPKMIFLKIRLVVPSMFKVIISDSYIFSNLLFYAFKVVQRNTTEQTLAD